MYRKDGPKEPTYKTGRKSTNSKQREPENVMLDAVKRIGSAVEGVVNQTKEEAQAFIGPLAADISAKIEQAVKDAGFISEIIAESVQDKVKNILNTPSIKNINIQISSGENKEIKKLSAGMIAFAAVIIFSFMLLPHSFFGVHSSIPSSHNSIVVKQPQSHATSSLATPNAPISSLPTTNSLPVYNSAEISNVASVSLLHSTFNVSKPGSNCGTLYNLTTPDQFNISSNGNVLIRGTVNFVTPNYGGFTLNNNYYTAYPGNTYAVTNATPAFSVTLSNLSYIPISHSIALQFCSDTPIQNMTVSGPPPGAGGGGGGGGAASPAAAPAASSASPSPPSGGGGGGGGGASTGGGGGGGGSAPASTATTSSSATTSVGSSSTTAGSTSTQSTTSATTTVNSDGSEFSQGQSVVVLYPATLWGTPTDTTYDGSVAVGSSGSIISSPQYDTNTGLWFYDISFNTGQT
jgi:hypothetical protein